MPGTPRGDGAAIELAHFRPARSYSAFDNCSWNGTECGRAAHYSLINHFWARWALAVLASALRAGHLLDTQPSVGPEAGGEWDLQRSAWPPLPESAASPAPFARNLKVYDMGRWDFHALDYSRWSINFLIFNSSDLVLPIEDSNDEVGSSQDCMCCPGTALPISNRRAAASGALCLCAADAASSI